jgi:ppGpp synthetase/RelA/SpoT-type nucleotidyltranferase
MKIARRLRELHSNRKVLIDRLASEIKDQLKPLVESKGWFFAYRVKELESFALKIETGRTSQPERLEDFFACTIVVPTLKQVPEAEELVSSLYDIQERRPKNDEETHKESSNFVFDDLRLYVARRPSSSGKNEDLEGVAFEVQIKTILQHAWAVATHDLIYKTDGASWAKERIAFQVKAMLEHAEVAIAEAESLSGALGVSKTDQKTTETVKLIELIKNVWSPDSLPKDVKRLAENIYGLMRACEVSVDAFLQIIQIEQARVGQLPTNLSPYAFVVQALANNTTIKFKDKFLRHRVRTRIVIHDEMDLPDWVNDPHERIVKIT